MISRPMLSVRISGGESGQDHLTLQRRFSASPEERRNLRSTSLPGKNSFSVFSFATMILMPFSEIFSMNIPCLLSPDMRSALRLILILSERRFSMAIL